ncbi:hypothetical protein CJ030_MR4G018543 [Morella rubra]|uniref:PAP/OAS1 substrate-binding-related domain-containing protein n=1 Tax=Morella rubra TaxID=262757 RepID=A0A6A1VQK7_9ROSI|nr:hypothetical protein CJ030_MR4G018543 [Morella rubra]
MGDVQVLAKEQLCAASSPLPASSSDPGSIGADSWAAAERNAEEIVGRIHPSLAAEYKRKEVIELYTGTRKVLRWMKVRQILPIETRLGIFCFMVFPYGSVPLKTYLPDGDIDLTAVSCLNIEDSLVSDVHTILKAEEHNEAAPFDVKDVCCIHAEVKLVKCIVQNICVDISFNQLGGLCKLCFLEQVDRLVGKDHLFKRSILLTKAWCYYQSRILGAHHALETNSQPFAQKHLNIIDPLRENNNLGRSVNRGNFYRIRSALKHGARKLGCILLLPVERIADELNMFFSCALGRHGNIWNAKELATSGNLDVRKTNALSKIFASEEQLGYFGLGEH